MERTSSITTQEVPELALGHVETMKAVVGCRYHHTFLGTYILHLRKVIFVLSKIVLLKGPSRHRLAVKIKYSYNCAYAKGRG